MVAFSPFCRMNTSRKISTTIATSTAIQVPLIRVGRGFFGAAAGADGGTVAGTDGGAVGIGSVTGDFGVSSLEVATGKLSATRSDLARWRTGYNLRNPDSTRSSRATFGLSAGSC